MKKNGDYFFYNESVKIYFERYGTGKRTILCIHGYGSSHETWYDILPYLEKHSSLILLDLKGFGLSSKPHDKNYSVENQAEIIISFLEKQNLNEVILAGQSYGAAAAAAAYINLKSRDKKLIAGLILIAALFFISDLPLLKLRINEPFFKRIIIRIVPAYLIALISLKRMFTDKKKVTPERVERYAKYIRQNGTEVSFVYTALQMEKGIRRYVIKELCHVNIPVIIIWGENDPLTPIAHAERINRIIVGSKLAVIGHCGHAPEEESPEETAKEIIKYLNENF